MQRFTFRFALPAAIFLLGILAALPACQKEEEGTLIVRFLAAYDGQPLTTFTIHPFDSPQRISFTHMSFFASDLTLGDGQDREILKDVELVNLSAEDILAAQEGFALTFRGVKAGVYNGFSFGMGVPPDLNADQPADYSSSNPLSKTSYYWGAWNSYIFMKTEGRLDTTGSGNLGLGFALHTGTDPLYRVLKAETPIEIVNGGATEIHLVLDYKTLLSGIGLKETPQNHNPSDTLAIQQLIKNLPSAVSLQL